jgi:ribosomal protein S18 acetylase RimI-like enzyme
MTLRITQATEHDLPHVHSLYLEYLQWLTETAEATWEYTAPMTVAEAAAQIMGDIRKFMPPDGRLLLARDDREVVGCASAWTIRPGLAEIKRVYVRPSGRGRGIARALMQTMIADLREAKYTHVRLDTAGFMTAAGKLYRSLGFEDIPPYHESETPHDMRHQASFLELFLR